MSQEAGTFTLLTPPGEGGIAVFAVEGRSARTALGDIIRCPRLAELAPGELAYGKLVSATGEILDEVIVAALPPPPTAHRPFDFAHGPERAKRVEGLPPTGVERFELNCHAGGAAAAAAAERMTEAGLAESRETPAEPGLSPEEARFRRALLEVKTRRQLEALSSARAGQTVPHLGKILATHRAVIAGPVNAGKSTLFNRLAGDDRAITSPEPGTTRDAVAVEVSVRGLAVELVDTAGLGALPGDELAAAAQELALAEVRRADLVLAVLDASAPPDEAVLTEIEKLKRAARRLLLVLNKSDRPAASTAHRHPPTAVRVSALTGAGLDDLAGAIERELLSSG